jgi:hypothetical protein
MDELDTLNPKTRRAWWWCLGVLAYVAWAISAVLEGDGVFTLIGGPLLVLVWVAAIIAVDRWVGTGVDRRQ